MSTVREVRNSRGIVAIALDDAESIRVRRVHFEKRPLSVGDEIDCEDYLNVVAAIQFSDAYEAALNALDLSARSKQELARSLRAKGYVPAAVDAVIERLSENRLLDDRRLAERIAESGASKPMGVYALKRKLMSKGISEEDAADSLELFDDEQQANAARIAAEKLYRRYSDLPAREARAKLSQALARRGFAWDAVSSAVDALLDDD